MELDSAQYLKKAKSKFKAILSYCEFALIDNEYNTKKDKNAKPITADHEPKTITPHKFALLDLLNVNFPFKVKSSAMKLLTLKNNDDIYCVNCILKNIKKSLPNKMFI